MSTITPEILDQPSAAEKAVAEAKAPKPFYKKKKFIALGVVGLIAVAGIAGGGGEASTDSPTDQAVAADSTYVLGTPVEADGLTVTINSVETGVERVGDSVLGMTAQGTYTVYDVTVTNSSDEPVQISMNYLFEAQDANGATYAPDVSASAYANDLEVNNSGYLDQLNPGNSTSFKVAFDVPEGVTLTEMTIDDSLNKPFTDGVTIKLA